MPSSCHNDSNFLFPPLTHADNSSLPSVSPFFTLLLLRRAPSSSSSSCVCCLKPSNEIHTKQDGRLGDFLRAVPLCLLLHHCIILLSYSLSLHLPIFIVLSICSSHFPPSLSVLLFGSTGLLFFPAPFFKIPPS